MAFKEITDLSTDKVIALGGKDKKSGKDNDSGLEGYYLGARQVESAKSKTGFSKIHVFKTAKGNVGLWGKTDSDHQLANVAPGTMTRITFVGMRSTKNNPMYKFKVETDSNNTIDVSGFALNRGTASTGADEDDGGGATYSNDDYGTEDEDSSDSFEQEDVAQSNQLSALERKQRVESLLNKKRK